MSCPYFLLDVFTETAFSGNPLAVVRDCAHLDAVQMQAIAREFNCSETIFVLPPADPVNSARLRIFTPSAELPFAGHPTVGGAILIAMQDAPDMIGAQELVIALEEGIGLIRCSVRRPQGRAIRATFEAPRLAQKVAEVDIDLAAQALGLSIEDIGFEDHRPRVYSAGNAFVFVPVASADAALRAKPDMNHWDDLVGAHDCIGAFLYRARNGDDGAHVSARMFAPSYGVPEDPATGSAAAAFAGACLDFERPGDGEHQIILEQGVEMGRPSEIVLTMVVRNNQLISVTIGGAAVVVASGTLNV